MTQERKNFTSWIRPTSPSTYPQSQAKRWSTPPTTEPRFLSYSLLGRISFILRDCLPSSLATVASAVVLPHDSQLLPRFSSNRDSYSLSQLYAGDLNWVSSGIRPVGAKIG